MRYSATIGERTVVVEMAENGHLRQVTVDGVACESEWQAVGQGALGAVSGTAPVAAGHYSLLLAGRSYDLYVRPVAEDASGASVEAAPEHAEQVFEVSLDGLPYVVRLADERFRALAGLANAAHERGEAALRAPMPGLVTNIMAAVGQMVERGQTVVVLEAMKMENDLGAPRGGVVRSIQVHAGQTVDQGQVLATIGEAEGAPSPANSGDDRVK